MVAPPAVAGPGCPGCGSTFLLRDGRKWWERMLGVRSAWRCNRCGARSRRWSASPQPDGPLETTGETQAAESRRTPRVKLLAKVEVRAESLESFRVAQSHNISMGGRRGAADDQGPAGMGIVFTEVSEESREVLRS